MGKNEAEAYVLALDNRITVGRVTYEKSWSTVGTVLRQTVEARTQVPEYETVDMVVSGGAYYTGDGNRIPVADDYTWSIDKLIVEDNTGGNEWWNPGKDSISADPGQTGQAGQENGDAGSTDSGSSEDSGGWVDDGSGWEIDTGSDGDWSSGGNWYDDGSSDTGDKWSSGDWLTYDDGSTWIYVGDGDGN